MIHRKLKSLNISICNKSDISPYFLFYSLSNLLLVTLFCLESALWVSPVIEDIAVTERVLFFGTDKQIGAVEFI